MMIKRNKNVRVAAQIGDLASISTLNSTLSIRKLMMGSCMTSNLEKQMVFRVECLTHFADLCCWITSSLGLPKIQRWRD
jgi:hypothetical protein